MASSRFNVRIRTLSRVRVHVECARIASQGGNSRFLRKNPSKKKESERRWQVIAEELNALNGANKSWESWRKTWQDRKSNAKKKFANARRQSNQTGGGPPPPAPNEEDEIILSTIPEIALIGHTDCQESIVEQIGFDSEVAQQQSESIAQQRSESNTDAVASTSQVMNIVNDLDDTQPNPEPLSTQIANPTQGSQNRLSRNETMIRSLQVAENLQKTLEDKNAYKKAFYEQYIKLMAQQTEALTMIAKSLNASAMNSFHDC